MTAITHPRLAARKQGARATTWWGKAWVRAVEEAAYAESELVAARALARQGHVGQIATEPGRFVASVEDRRGLWTVEGSVPVLDQRDLDVLVEAVAAESGRIAPLPAVGAPFLVFTGLAVWLFVGSRTRPGDTPISRLVLAMSAWFRRALKPFQRKERAA